MRLACAIQRLERSRAEQELSTTPNRHSVHGRSVLACAAGFEPESVLGSLYSSLPLPSWLPLIDS